MQDALNSSSVCWWHDRNCLRSQHWRFVKATKQPSRLSCVRSGEDRKSMSSPDVLVQQVQCPESFVVAWHPWPCIRKWLANSKAEMREAPPTPPAVAFSWLSLSSRSVVLSSVTTQRTPGWHTHSCMQINTWGRRPRWRRLRMIADFYCISRRLPQKKNKSTLWHHTMPRLLRPRPHRDAAFFWCGTQNIVIHSTCIGLHKARATLFFLWLVAVEDNGTYGHLV